MTRDEQPGGALFTALREAGLTPVLEPVITRCVLEEAAAAIASLGPSDWLVLTSPFAVSAVPADAARVPRVAVVGEASRRAAAARGFRVALVGGDGTAAGLFAALARRAAAGTRVLYPRSSQATVPKLPRALTVQCPVLYETRPRRFRRAVVEEVDLVTMVSPSAVAAVGVVDLPVATIGPSTTAALRATGREPWLEAPEPSFPALARAVADQADSSANQRA